MALADPIAKKKHETRTDWLEVYEVGLIGRASPLPLLCWDLMQVHELSQAVFPRKGFALAACFSTSVSVSLEIEREVGLSAWVHTWEDGGSNSGLGVCKQ